MLPGDRLHLGVLRQAAHVEPADPAVTCRAHDAAHQLGPDAVLLQRLFDRKGRFRLAPPRVAELLELGRGAQLIAVEVAVDDAAHVGHAGRIILDKHV